MKTNERIIFRLFSMECCGHFLCWVNPRVPNYCPECGKGVFPQVRGWAVLIDDTAHIRYDSSDSERVTV